MFKFWEGKEKNVMSKVIRSIYAQHPTYFLAYSVGRFFVDELQTGVHADLYQAVMQFLSTQMSSLKCTVGMPIEELLLMATHMDKIDLSSHNVLP